MQYLRSVFILIDSLCNFIFNLSKQTQLNQRNILICNKIHSSNPIYAGIKIYIKMWGNILYYQRKFELTNKV